MALGVIATHRKHSKKPILLDIQCLALFPADARKALRKEENFIKTAIGLLSPEGEMTIASC